MATITTKERVPYRIWDKVNSKWNELKFKTNANSVDAEDGKTLETKVGVINGITSDLSGEADDVAASIKCVNQLNNNLGTFSFYHDPNIVHLVADDKVYSVEDNTYVLADSSTGATLLADTDTYYAKTLAGNYCSAGGADTVVPFTADNNSYFESNQSYHLVKVAEVSISGSVDVSSYPGYENFTVDNFVLKNAILQGSSTFNAGPTYNYDPETGIFSYRHKGNWIAQSNGWICADIAAEVWLLY